MQYIQLEPKSQLVPEDLKNICDALRDLVPFVQFKKREKHPWKSVNFSKVECNLKIFRKPSRMQIVVFVRECK